MRVLIVVPCWEPRTGALVTTREYVQHLAAAGHAVAVVTTTKEPGEPRTVDSVKVWPLRYWRAAAHLTQPEVLISHHGDRRAAKITAQLPRVPHLLMVHGMSENRDLGRAALAWFPSRACRAHYPAYHGRSIVLPPPINPDRYRTTPGALVTLNGSTAAKGADVVAQVAGLMPGSRFLVVRTPRRDDPPMPGNVELADRTDPRQLYTRTRILLMPSATESYGRAGVEAMLSGIPVLASPLPGMREALGSAATYIAREDTSRWVHEIRRLSQPAAYAEASARACAHTEALDYAGSLRSFEEACASLVPRPTTRPRPQRRPATTARAVIPAMPTAAAVVAWVHYGVPYRRAGSETMLHTMMRALRDAGTDVLVVCSEMHEAPPVWDVDGVPYAQLDTPQAEALIRRMQPTTLVTHHHFASRAVALSKHVGAQSVLLLHNDHDQPALKLSPDLCVFNTEWVLKSLAFRYPQIDPARSLVIHPPVIPEEHRTPITGTHVTLVNLNRHKGVDTWRGAAGLLRRLPFLGVIGAHGEQIRRPVLPNMRVIGQTSDMRGDVWARTRVLLMPSIYESFGMAAVEALASGIPVIAHPTPGLREALGDAGQFIDRSNVHAWAAAIQDLHRDGPHRARESAAARARSQILADQSRAELAAWVDAVRVLASGRTHTAARTVRQRVPPPERDDEQPPVE
ncbi:glycosyltransferase [Streptomyces sp. A5-4]|uniref:glycosyltransferase n=1 Tax=Streptomyces sp. A5-4 TaxID=3384771 RepID=UPI003DA827A9